MNLAVWLERAARLWPTSPALLTGSDVVADYQRFAARVSSIAGGFRDRFAVAPGDRVAIFMSNRFEYLEVMYAAWYVGAVVVPINAKLRVNEVAWMIRDAGAALTVCTQNSAELLAAAVDPQSTAILVVDSAEFAALYAAKPTDRAIYRDQDDLAWLFYTSGTTGRPKGVMLSHGNLAAMALSYFVDVDSVRHDDAVVYAAPISHGAGLYNFMFVIRGSRHVFPKSGSFDAAELAMLAGKLGNVCMFAAPTMVRRMTAEARRSGYDGAGIRTIVYGGGPMYASDVVEAIEVLGPRFAQIYGQGESPMTITALSRDLVAASSHPDWRKWLETVGRAHSCVEVKVTDGNGRTCGIGEVGEIVVRGATVMRGYWRNEQATRETLAEGWLKTGDLGALDKQGFLTLHGRSKDVIISGGTNIYPREVEEALLTHPAVAQASVIGQTDREWGEIVVAFVVLENGRECSEEMLDLHCIAHIARFKRPKRYVFMTELPKNAYGKVLKTQLRAAVADGNTNES